MEAQGAALFLTHMLACLSSCLLKMRALDIICVSVIREKFGDVFSPFICVVAVGSGCSQCVHKAFGKGCKSDNSLVTHCINASV